MPSGEQIAKTPLKPDRSEIKVKQTKEQSKLRYTLILMHLPIKTAPGTLMNKLLKPPLRSSLQGKG